MTVTNDQAGQAPLAGLLVVDLSTTLPDAPLTRAKDQCEADLTAADVGCAKSTMTTSGSPACASGTSYGEAHAPL